MGDNERVKFFFQAEDGIRDDLVTGVQTCALPISDICIKTPHTSRSDADISVDINFLGQVYLDEGHHLYTPGQTQSYIVIDAIGHGLSKLQGGALQSFLEKHVDIL